MKPLTGRKVLGIALGAFAVILAPNLILAYYASATFAGLIVPNSYVASQQFNDRTRAQEALGWTLGLELTEDALHVRFKDQAGAPVRPPVLVVTVGRPTTEAEDKTLDLLPTGTGYIAPITLAAGNWLVLVNAETADGTRWKQRHTLHVRH